jgi:hypothetical protein
MQTASNQTSIADKTPSDVIDKRNQRCEPLDQHFDIYTKELSLEILPFGGCMMRLGVTNVLPCSVTCHWSGLVGASRHACQPESTTGDEGALLHYRAANSGSSFYTNLSAHAISPLCVYKSAPSPARSARPSLNSNY